MAALGQARGQTRRSEPPPPVLAIGIAVIRSNGSLVAVAGLKADALAGPEMWLAARIAERCLVDKRIVSVLVRVEKLERGPEAVGVEIVRSRNP